MASGRGLVPSTHPGETFGEVAPAAPVSVPSITIGGGSMDIVGAARSTTDRDAAIAAGFSPKATVYTRGTRVIRAGVDKARLERKQYDAKPLVAEYCADFVAQIEAEKRTDVPVLGREVSMDDTGALSLDGGVNRFQPTYGALSGLATRLEYGGAQYLAKCPPALRATNVNDWRARIAAREDLSYRERCELLAKQGKPAPEPSLQELVLRVRQPAVAGDLHEAFGVVTPSYTSFDVDKVAKVIAKVVHPDARGTVTYDGERARFEVLFHSDVKPEHYVAGEFWKAGLIINTDDIGSGSIWGQSAIWQNLCLNLIIIDKQAKELFRLKHVGSAEALELALIDGIARGEKTLEHFTRAWGYACQEDVLARTAAAHKAMHEEEMPIRIEDALPGIFGAILERELVSVPGRKEAAIPKLVKAWEFDQSGAKIAHGGLTRAAICNAFTRYAHTEVRGDVWAEDQIQRQAGALLWAPLRSTSATPDPLPWMDLEA